MISLKNDKEWLERNILQVFNEEDYDGGIYSLRISEYEDKNWIVAEMSTWDRFGSEIVCAYINVKSGEVNGDLVDSFNKSLNQKILDKFNSDRKCYNN